MNMFALITPPVQEHVDKHRHTFREAYCNHLKTNQGLKK